MIIVALSIAAAFFVIAAVMIRRETRWKHCPRCHWYHCGKFSGPFLPGNTRSRILVKVCPACIETADFFKKRETEIAKEISRRPL